MTQERAWLPDPTKRHQYRYWDGSAWTEHVADNGVQSVDPTDGLDRFDAALTLDDAANPVVNQKAKLIELNNQYGVFDRSGRQIGAVNQVGQSTLKKAMRLLSSVDQFMTHRLEVVDSAGTVVLMLTRPAKVFKSTVVVEDPREEGTEDR